MGRSVWADVCGPICRLADRAGPGRGRNSCADRTGYSTVTFPQWSLTRACTGGAGSCPVRPVELFTPCLSGADVHGDAALCDARPVTSIQVADQGFIAAPAHDVAALIARRRSWRRWWPDLALQVREDRGDKGVRWTVSGPLAGTMEVWLEPVLDGVVVHYFLHAEPAPESARLRDPAEENRRRRVAGKTMVFEVKSILEAGRAPGEPPRHRTAG